MEDDIINFDDSKFILSYEIIDNKINIKYSNGELLTIPYSKNNYNMVISKMKSQISNVVGGRDFDEEKLNNCLKFVISIQPIVLPMQIIGFINYGGFYYGALLTISSIATVAFISNTINKIKSKKRANKKIETNNLKPINNNEETKQIKNTKTHSINNYSLNDFNISNSNVNEEEKGPVLIKHIYKK